MSARPAAIARPGVNAGGGTLAARARALLDRRFVRFVLVGVANTAFGYGVYAMGVLAGLPPQIALALQFALGVLWNFTLHARLVFARRGWARLPAYIAAYVAIYLTNAVALRMMIGLGVGPLWAQLAILPGIVVLSWLLIRRVMAGGAQAAPTAPADTHKKEHVA